MFFTNLLEANLKVKNIAKNIFYYTATNSTSDDLWDLYNNESLSKTLIITDNQKNGRGRLNNKWFSKPSHSITCSFLLNQIFKSEKLNLHSILIPVVIIKGIKNFLSLELSIKWPNDIMYKNKKLGGILIESKLNNNTYIFNIGIGINVNEQLSDFPFDLQSSSISLREIKGSPIQREPLLGYILNELDNYINNKDEDILIHDWMNYCMHINKPIKFKNENHVVNGIFKMINDKGQAVILHDKEYIEYNGAIRLV
tara:strand:- start:282 stop:1046 length:765 start_codon:yes stop_codon:yes gene_type:complete